MDDQLLTAITTQIARAQQLVRSLYGSCDLSIDDCDALSRGLGGGELLIVEIARLQATHADLKRVAQAAELEARQQRGALRAALQSILAIAEARSDGTWDDVMRTARAALEEPSP
jgi:hypothetical protein